jgi:site-specific DNA-methyltransferase (adenine-specific)
MIDLDGIQLHHGDCREVLASLPDCSVDSVVTDPPYELGFMGKAWDGSGIAYSVEMWAEVLRVLKPGGHLCAFGGTRTYHRMACAIEDAGFEIRDSLHWVYGSGFPKSLDVSKAIDKTDAVQEQQARRYRFTEWVRSTGLTAKQIDEATDTFMGNHYTTHPTQPAIMTLEHLDAVRHLIGEVPEWVEAECKKRSVESKNFAQREVIATARMVDTTRARMGFAGERYSGENANATKDVDITTAATDAAKQWEGWGTALKPAHEPIVLARRPLIGTVAANVLTHGTGALNIDGARVDMGDEYDPTKVQRQQHSSGAIEGAFGAASLIGKEIATYKPGGRWPANVIFDTEAGALLDEQSGVSRDGVAVRRNGVRGGEIGPPGAKAIGTSDMGYGGQGGASRFFTSIEWEPEIDAPFRYIAKPSKQERNAGLDGLPEVVGKRTQDGGDDTRGRPTPTNQNHHPTVKPLALMRWLVRLVTPPGGTVLEPFAGSGTTLMACVMEGFNGIGIEMTDEYLPIIEGRVRWAQAQPPRLFL